MIIREKKNKNSLCGQEAAVCDVWTSDKPVKFHLLNERRISNQDPSQSGAVGSPSIMVQLC
jgi:hypothetical protein